MQTASKDLLADLRHRTEQVLQKAEGFRQQSLEQLNARPGPESWSALECLEHLNRYGDFYLAEIRKRIQESKHPAQTQFKAGWLGDYFAKMMLPREKLNKMKTMSSMNPLGSELDKSTLEKFIGQQKEMLGLLEEARKVDLQRTKSSITLASWVKLRLGDIFRVVIYHNQRHMVQAEKAMAASSPK